ncbi:hypothetical protein BGW36DRAFT_355363 [Talaromyces proteolyticus]|uniref:Uncharacterized protein n=1 Tax=Talaromyces proteolyticus TaxID=1131652 RepID=A0AAD4L5K4_9EURO|nr:uncharacterized protein BGW36DRAFT_355363 [Talaromyces proteolyticus]KAH8703977.1 hypothetical protein BGW36DRAFT_355363 [Talaromyces proteolyticus]
MTGNSGRRGRPPKDDTAVNYRSTYNDLSSNRSKEDNRSGRKGQPSHCVDHLPQAPGNQSSDYLFGLSPETFGLSSLLFEEKLSVPADLSSLRLPSLSDMTTDDPDTAAPDGHLDRPLSFPNTPSDFFPTTLLIEILGGIAQQFAGLVMYPWDPTQMRILRLQNFIDPTAAPISPGPLRNTLFLMSRFTMALQAIAPKDGSLERAMSTKEPLPISTILLLLSTYLELIRLLDTILKVIRDYLRQSISIDNSMSSLYFSASQQETSTSWHSPIAIMIPAFETQLGLIERLIGFPSTYRIWSFEDSYPGLIGGIEPSALLDAVMGQSNCIANGLGMSQVSSLKQNIEHIHLLLLPY